MSGSAKRIVIDVVSDTICPWCFIGKRRLETAIKSFTSKNPNSASFEINWHPFELDPTLTEKPINQLERLEKKFGKGKMDSILPMMTKLGKSLDPPITFSYSKDKLVSSTLLTHQLITYIGANYSSQIQNQLVEKLFSFFFEQDGDISSIPALVKIANEVSGCDVEKAKKYLEDKEGLEKVQKEIRSWQMRGVRGVPHFIVNGRYPLHGAQDSDLFEELFEQLVG
ncbi:thioredoxin-like protein [Paraphysoderma sedebokerense]|nr:thioredoxin-like protein [Paraphysoderma sedebokerense]